MSPLLVRIQPRAFLIDPSLVLVELRALLFDAGVLRLPGGIGFLLRIGSALLLSAVIDLVFVLGFGLVLFFLSIFCAAWITRRVLTLLFFDLGLFPGGVCAILLGASSLLIRPRLVFGGSVLFRGPVLLLLVAGCLGAILLTLRPLLLRVGFILSRLGAFALLLVLIGSRLILAALARSCSAFARCCSALALSCAAFAR